MFPGILTFTRLMNWPTAVCMLRSFFFYEARAADLICSQNNTFSHCCKTYFSFVLGQSAKEIMQLLSFVEDIVHSNVIDPQINPRNLAYEWHLFLQKFPLKSYLSGPKMVPSLYIGLIICLEENLQNSNCFEKCLVIFS